MCHLVLFYKSCVNKHREESNATLAVSSIDRVYGERLGGSPSRLIRFYADISSKGFLPMYSKLLSLAEEGAVWFVLRYRPPRSPSDALWLTGYGVSMNLKSMEYIAIDDRNANSMLCVVFVVRIGRNIRRISRQ